jgi:putative FmdB family regulatory protein
MERILLYSLQDMSKRLRYICRSGEIVSGFLRTDLRPDERDGDEMPTYEYECNECKFRFEKFQNMSAEPIRVCPECGGEVRRLIGSGGGLIFKGAGFYANDYASKGSCKDKPSCCGSGGCSCDKD